MTTTDAVTTGGPAFTIHDRCRKAREHAKLEQGELAEKIEVSRQTISNYETGTVTHLHRGTLRRWAMACGVGLDWLYGEDAPGQYGPGGTKGLRSGSNKRGHSTRSNHTGPGRDRVASARPARTGPATRAA